VITAAVLCLALGGAHAQEAPVVEQPAVAVADEAAAETAEPDLWATGISPTRAVLMSPLFPGWGQLYARNDWRAAVAFGIQTFYLSNLVARDRKAQRVRNFAATLPEDELNRELYDSAAEELWEQMRDFAWWAGGAMMILALDAYVGAHLFNFDQDAVPVPDRWDQFLESDTPEPVGTVDSRSLIVFQWRLSF